MEVRKYRVTALNTGKQTSIKKGVFEGGRMDMAESVIMTSRSELPRIVNGAFVRK